MRQSLHLTLIVLASLLLPMTTACSDDASTDDGDATPDAGSDAATPEPEDPTAEVAEKLEGGNGVLLAAVAPTTLPDGWVEEEFAVEGSAVGYAAEGELPADGNYTLREEGSAEYRTRIVVRRPESAAEFNGTVVVEWLNVSGGFDANPDWTYTADELLRGGYAWVGVSAQFIGIEGGPVLVSLPIGEMNGAGEGIKKLDPARYGELSHPGDAFAYDIYTQVGRLLRRADDGVLGELEPQRLLAVGESQSAFMLTTYYNGVQPLTHTYDGFFIHSRGGGAAPLGMPGAGIDLVAGISAADTTLRTDLDVPAFIVQTETDMLYILGYFPARQPDSDSIHTWEIAGTAHADAYLLGAIEDTLGCDAPVNAGPAHFVVKAALRHLDGWVSIGDAPPTAERLEIDDAATPAFVLDADGNALGGVRTPLVDVPVDTLSGAPKGTSIACMLFGSTTPLSEDRLAELYDSRAAYVDAYEAAADTAIEGGFVLEDDRQALLDASDPERIGE